MYSAAPADWTKPALKIAWMQQYKDSKTTLKDGQNARICQSGKWNGRLYGAPTTDAISFLVLAVYDILPSSTNLHIRIKRESPSHSLCVNRGSLQHIFNGCFNVLTVGRHRWRHNQVFKATVDTMDTGICFITVKQDNRTINFYQSREKIPTTKIHTKQQQKKTPTNLLSSAVYSHIRMDLGHQLKLPQQIKKTNLHPDIDELNKVNVIQIDLWKKTRKWPTKWKV